MKHFDSTKEKYSHLSRSTTLLTSFLHRRCQDFTIEIIGKHCNDPIEHGWDGDS
jgi:hypothetical protein